VIVPPALLAAPERSALTQLAAIGVPAVVVVGAAAVSVGVSLPTTVEGMPPGQDTSDAALVLSPLYFAYHQ
jgi:hypothetical protein